MTRRHMLYTALVAVHLIFVAFGAAQWSPLPPTTPEGKALDVVRAYTGSSTSYGFFAPGVSATLRPMFTLVDAEGKTWKDTLDPDLSREAQLRVGSGVGMVGSFPGLTLYFAQSWAATLLGRHPKAVTVIVEIEMFEVPTMEECRNQGKKPQWVVVFPSQDDPPDIGVFHRNEPPRRQD